MISETEHQRITSELSKFFKECNICNIFLSKEFHYYKDEILSGDYSDDDIEAIIRGSLNDYEVHILSMCIQMFGYYNCKDRLEENKYCVLVDYMKNGNMFNFLVSFDYEYTYDKMERITGIKKDYTMSCDLKKYGNMFNFLESFDYDYKFDTMERITGIKKDYTISGDLKKYELLLFMDEILKLNENKKFI
jgi:hypothetical protein